MFVVEMDWHHVTITQYDVSFCIILPSFCSVQQFHSGTLFNRYTGIGDGNGDGDGPLNS